MSVHCKCSNEIDGTFHSDRSLSDFWVSYWLQQVLKLRGTPFSEIYDSNITLSLVVRVTFFTCLVLLPLQNQLYPFLQSKNHILLAHASEQTCALKTFSEIEGQQTYSRRKDYFDHFFVAQVIIVRVFFHF